MSFGPQVAMSGAFHFESPNGASPMSGAHAGIFQPPMSPSTSSSVYLSKSNGSLASDAQTPAPNVNRKRLRHGEMTPSHDGMMNGGYNTNDRMGQRRISGGTEIRYTLGGQIETPNGMVQNQLGGDMESSTYSDVDYRRALGSQRAHDENDSTMPGQNRTDIPMEPEPAQPTGWLSAFALNTIGGVVGKVWEFCKTGAFRGFYAGGGRAFDAQANPLPGNDEAFQMALEYGHSPAPTPAAVPESDYTPFYYEQEPDSTPPPAAKRRQISANTPSDELRKNWVMVNEPAEQMTPPAPVSHHSMDRPSSALQNRPSIPRRISKPVSRLSTAPNLNRRHSGRISHAGDPSLTFREPASFAGPRSMIPASMIPAPERPSTPTPSRLPIASRPQSPAFYTPSPRQPSRIPSPSPHILRGNHRRNHSAASAASVGLAATPATGKAGPVRRRETLVEEVSPRLDPEAQEMVARRLREERAADARINDFNARLQAMIRQGQEALGTSFEGGGQMDYGGSTNHWDDEY
ncbi:uncharacterized protein PG986_005772 [Apiospora aurea]|uniref:Uncharacterized protein n=1 Tax=Apiospora aurea TaxID=335848 RepID=A0ABR1QIK1_9PEZI